MAQSSANCHALIAQAMGCLYRLGVRSDFAWRALVSDRFCAKESVSTILPKESDWGMAVGWLPIRSRFDPRRRALYFVARNRRQNTMQVLVIRWMVVIVVTYAALGLLMEHVR